jgi:hypothetical protein
MIAFLIDIVKRFCYNDFGSERRIHMKNWLVAIAVIAATISGLLYWRERAYEAEHFNGTRMKMECPQQDGIPSPCVLHVAMPDIDRSFHIDHFTAGRSRSGAVIVEMDYSSATIHGTMESELPYKWRFDDKDSFPQLVSTVRLERDRELLARADVP